MLLERTSFRRLCRARDMLAEVREPALSLRDVAQELRLSPFHLIRQFDALFGETPHQYRIRTRLEEAKRLLAAGELSVTDVCLEVGFSSLGSFSDLFARRIGVSPSVYRRQVRTLVQVPQALRPPLEPGCLTLLAFLPAEAFRNFREAPPAGGDVHLGRPFRTRGHR